MKTPLYQEIYASLLNDIGSGAYPLGAKIPSETELAQKYNVSRITPKKALEMLVTEGYVTRYPGKGTFVMKIPADNPVAQNHTDTVLIPGKKRKLIGFVMGSITQSFGSRSLMVIERACAEYGYHLLFGCSMEDQNRETNILESFMDNDVSGIIIMPVHGEAYNPYILKLSLGNTPIVFLDRNLRGILLPSVSSDHFLMAKELTDHLFSLGRRRLAFVCTQYYETSSILDRLNGFIQSNIEHGHLASYFDWLDKNTGLLLENTNESRSEDIASIKAYIQRTPDIDGFLAVEIEVALLIREALIETGRYNDKEENIVCFDGYLNYIKACRFTTAIQNEEEIGRQCVRVLIEALDGTIPPGKTIIPHKIVYAHPQD